MEKRILLATGNAHKLTEFRRLLQPLADTFTFVGADELPSPLPDVTEDGASFMENARKKARCACAASGMPSLADDSGLCVDALHGAPGVYSARYAALGVDDFSAGVPAYSAAARRPAQSGSRAKLLRVMAGVGDRAGHFICALCVAYPDGTSIEVEGRCDGEIMRVEAGDNGFGYDTLFQCNGYPCSFAQLSAAQKDQASHRGDAFRALIARLQNTETGDLSC